MGVSAYPVLGKNMLHTSRGDPRGRPLGGNDTEAGISPLTVDVTCRLLVQHLVAQYRFLHIPPKRPGVTEAATKCKVSVSFRQG